MSATEFFQMEIVGGSMADAARGTRKSYQTIHAIRHGSGARAETAKALEAWSRTVPAAQESGVYISAAKTLGLEEPSRDSVV